VLVSLTRLSVIKGATSEYVDAINDIRILDGVAHVPARSSISVSGWAVDSGSATPAAAVRIDIEGKLYQVRYGISRPDVASVLKVPAYNPSGYEAIIPASDIGTGLHRLTPKIVNHDRSGYYVGRSIQFDYR